jgi:hypothetical protein
MDAITLLDIRRQGAPHLPEDTIRAVCIAVSQTPMEDPKHKARAMEIVETLRSSGSLTYLEQQETDLILRFLAETRVPASV